MPRNMSFALTTKQFRDRTKLVTRRLGWGFLKAGDIVQGCEKCQGLKKGQKVQRIHLIHIDSVRRERVYEITPEDCILEGFPDLNTVQFMQMFCRANKCNVDRFVQRIQFRYVVEPDAWIPVAESVARCGECHGQLVVYWADHAWDACCYNDCELPLRTYATVLAWAKQALCLLNGKGDNHDGALQDTGTLGTDHAVQQCAAKSGELQQPVDGGGLRALQQDPALDPETH